MEEGNQRLTKRLRERITSGDKRKTNPTDGTGAKAALYAFISSIVFLLNPGLGLFVFTLIIIFEIFNYFVS